MSAHNKAVLAKLKEGDMVEFPRGGYSHWAVYVGNGRVIHLTSDSDEKKEAKGDPMKMFSICGVKTSKACVKEDDFYVVANDSNAKINNDKDLKCKPHSQRAIVKAARAKLGKMDYSVLFNNCEHFASFCRYGEGWSEQIDVALSLSNAL